MHGIAQHDERDAQDDYRHAYRYSDERRVRVPAVHSRCVGLCPFYWQGKKVHRE